MAETQDPKAEVDIGQPEQNVPHSKDDVSTGTNDPTNPANGPRNITLGRILRYAPKSHRWILAGTAFISALNGALLPVMNIVFGRVVQNFNEYSAPGSQTAEPSFQHEINRLTLYIIYIFVAKLALSFISKYAFRHVGLVLCATLRKEYFTAIFNQSVGTIDELKPGNTTYALTTAVTSLQNALADKLEILFECIGLIIAAYVVGFTHSWELTLASTSLTLLVCVCFGTIVGAVNASDRGMIENDSSAAAEASNVMRWIRVVKSLGAEEAMAARHRMWNSQSWKHGLKKSPFVGVLFGLYFFCAYGNVALTFWVGLTLYQKDRLGNVGDLVTTLFSLVAIMPAVGALAPLTISIIRAMVGTELLFDLIDAEPVKNGGLKVPEALLSSDIIFEHVRFAYPTRTQVAVLQDVQLTIPRGKATAILGSSGCGKSTIVALLERWYDLSERNTSPPSTAQAAIGADVTDSTQNVEKAEPEPIQNHGAIRLGQHNIESLDRRWWRSQIGLVEQESVLFNETIYDNVARGLEGTTQLVVGDVQKRTLVEQACKDAYAHDFIVRLAKGYETIVGEGGVQLSGGQRQRIAIARCIVKRPSLLIFDEATSAIDVHSENIVSRAIAEVIKGRTAIIITHRISTVQTADYIAVLDRGVVVEQGLREELAAKQGSRYSDLVVAQQLQSSHAQDGEQDVRSAHVVEETVKSSDCSARQITRQVTVQDCAEDGLDGQPSAKEETEMKGFLTSMRLLISAMRQHRLRYFLLLAGCLGAGGATSANSVIVANFIVAFQSTGDNLMSRGRLWAGMALVLTFAATSCYCFLGWASNSLSINVSSHYRQAYYEAMLRQPISWFDSDSGSSDSVTSRLSNDPQQMQEVSGPNMLLPVTGLFTLAGVILLGLIVGWKLTLVTLVAVVPIIILTALITNLYEKYFEAFTAKVFVESGQHAAESVRSFRTVVALTCEASSIARYEKLLEDHTRKAISRARLVALVFSLGNSLEFCCIALTFWYGGKLQASREYDVLQFMIIYAALVQGGQTAGMFLSYSPNFAQAKPALNRILEMCIAGPQRLEAEAARESQVLPITNSGACVEFNTVTFTYASQQRPVLRDFSISVPAGSYVAFVGPSGCGKTSVLSLLQRFYTPTSGHITIDGIEIGSILMSKFRSVCALVSQDPVLFSGSIRENLTLGLSDSDMTQHDLETACRGAEIHDFIATLPDGYDSLLSGSLNASMSGGQKQRMCIARAFLRKPRLLLLDEATSSLDSKNESAVQRAIERMAGDGNLTIIAVAHRLATVQNADRIFVLDLNGRIVEEGKHLDLIERKGGVYWQMCEAQALLN